MIDIMKIFKENTTSFGVRGRINRMQFAIGLIIWSVVSAVPILIMVVFLNNLLGILLSILLAVYLFGRLILKRAHDIGKSGILLFSLWLVYVVISIIVFFKEIVPTITVFIPILLLGAVVSIGGFVLLFKAGEQNTNHFGTVPIQSPFEKKIKNIAERFLY